MHGPWRLPWRLVIRTLSPFLHYIVCASVNDYMMLTRSGVLQTIVEKERLKTKALVEEAKREAQREAEEK